MLAVSLALVAAVTWGVADFIAGILSRRLAALLVLLGQQVAGLLVVGAVLLMTGEALPGERGILLSLSAGLAGALALSAFYRALAVGTMSIVAPIASTSIALPFAAGVAMGERPSGAQLAGLALAAVGVLLAARETTGAQVRLPSARIAVGLALLAAVGFGSFATLADAAADESIPWFLLLARVSAIGVVAAAILLTRSSRPSVPALPAVAVIAAVGLLDLAATALYGLAMTKGLLSVVSVVGAMFPVVTALMGWLVLHERLSRSQAVGVVIAFTGVAFIAGG